jgi:predicted lipoprotein with Yx(FWY)xxD motif
MRHPKVIIAGIGLAAVAAVGGVTAAAAAGGTSASGPAAGHSATAATVRTASVTVAGKTETILVNSSGLPLYFYRPDTAVKSLVTGGVAELWPALTSAAPTAAGASGKLTVVNDTHGHQVAYNGHLLYTFTSDHAGQVTGGHGPGHSARPGLWLLKRPGAPVPLTPCLRAESAARGTPGANRASPLRPLPSPPKPRSGSTSATRGRTPTGGQLPTGPPAGPQ